MQKKNIPALAGLLLMILVGVPLAIFLSRKQQTVEQHAAGNSCNHTGVTNNNGIYSFAKLIVDTNGILRDATGCEVYLLGAQGKSASPTQSNQYVLDDPSQFTYLQLLQKTVMMNELRVPMTVINWNSNPTMQKLGITYQAFVKEYVQYIEKQGDYVQFDMYQDGTPQQGADALTSMAKTFLGDPAVLYDVRNESLPKGESCTQGLAENTQWLQALQNVDPTLVKVVPTNCLLEMENGTNSFYTGISNLILDFHIYSGYDGPDPFGKGNGHCKEPNPNWPTLLQTDATKNVPFLHQHHAGYIHNEWGGLL